MHDDDEYDSDNDIDDCDADNIDILNIRTRMISSITKTIMTMMVTKK